MCGAPLRNNQNRQLPIAGNNRASLESSEPRTNGGSIVGNPDIQTIKFSFRAGIDKNFLEKLKTALVQRKWLLYSAPPVPQQAGSPQSDVNHGGRTPTNATHQRVVGIAGLEQRGVALRQNNQAVIGTAFEDLAALMTSAKDVIKMAEQFARQAETNTITDPDARRIISDSASALGLITTKDMLGSGSTAEHLYTTELSRNLAEYLTDDRKGILRKEGGIISLVDLWQVFNRTRNGIELISPLDFQKAANMWDTLGLPVRLRRFKSGLLVVQDRSRTDAKTIASLLDWLRKPPMAVSSLSSTDAYIEVFGRGATAQDTAEKFGWSVGVATEELEMAEEMGALCRDQCLDGIRFWENHFAGVQVTG
jgi:ESCRT-II complex subunit VPS36